MSIEHPESSVNELLIPSAEENEKKTEAKLQWLFLPARLFLIIIVRGGYWLLWLWLVVVLICDCRTGIFRRNFV